MRSGNRIVLLFALFAACVATVLYVYSRQTAARRPPQTPVTASRAFLNRDNTVVGMLGGVEVFEPLRVEGAGPARGIEARVLGARDSGRLYADLEFSEQKWEVRRAAFVISDGTRLPLRGTERPALEP